MFPINRRKNTSWQKKIGFGRGKYNGFGGHVEAGESIEKAVIRELMEESGLRTNKKDIEKYAELDFSFPNALNKGWNQKVHVYLAHEFKGEPKESDEMTYEWFSLKEIPYDKIWDADKYWMPLILEGKKIKGNFTFNKNNETIKSKEIIENA